MGPYTPLRLLHANDYVMEKAFVYGILALSKWLGQGRYPQGIYGAWPPKIPRSQVPDNLAASAVDLIAPPPLPPPAEAPPDDRPRHLRRGRPAASSGS